MFNSVDMELLSSEIANNNAVIFVGAGFSKNAVPKNEYVSSKFMDWMEFIKLIGSKIWPEIADENKLSEKCTDFLYVVQLFKDRFGEDEFYKMVKLAIPTNDYIPSNIHKELLGIPWTDVITTNMDNLIEKTFNLLNIPHELIIDDEQISINSNPYPKIIKMHGTWDRPNTIVFSEEDYRLYEEKHPLMVVKIKQIFAERTVFFIGFSLTDPNFKKIFFWIKDILKKYQKKAYAFIPNADRNEVEYWRSRNIVIFNNSDISFDYMQYLNNFISDLKGEIDRFNVRNFKQVSKYLFKDVNYKEEAFKLMDELDFYLEKNKKNDVYRIINVLIENIDGYLKMADKHANFNQFKINILNELLLMDGDGVDDYLVYNLPNIIFEEFNNICSNENIRYKLVNIFCKYIELNKTTKITIEKRIKRLNEKNSFPIPKVYNLYEIMSCCDFIGNNNKELILYNKVKELYYDERDYGNTIKFIKDNDNYIKNLYYRDEIKYIELLCYKHFCDYDKILSFLRQESFNQQNSLNDLRLGYLNYLVNDMVYMKKNYEKALNNEDKNVSHSLTAIYSLRLMAISNLYYGNGSYNEYLQNKEEQINDRISLNAKDIKIFRIKDYLMNLETSIIENLTKSDNDRMDYRRNIKLFNDFVRITEYYGVPDIFVSNSSCFQVLFNLLRNDLEVNLYLDSFFSFGVYTKEKNANDKIIDYGKNKEHIFNVLKNNIEKNVKFLTNVKINNDFTGFSFPVRMLDESIKYLLNVVSVFDESWMKLIAESMFLAIDLNLQQVNNSIKENASKLIVKIINILSQEQAIILFQKYLQFIIDKDLDWLLEIDTVNFNGWNTNVFKNFNYKLVVDLFYKIESTKTHRIEDYFIMVLNMNSKNPIPIKYKEELLKTLSNLKKYAIGRTYLLLLRDIGEKYENIKSILDNNYKTYVERTNNDLSNRKTFSISTAQIYYTFGALIDYIEIDKQRIILELGLKEVMELSKLGKNGYFALSYKKYLMEAVQYYIVKYSIKNNDFSEFIIYVKKYTLHFDTNLSEALRGLFEREPEMMNDILENFINKLKSNDKEDKIKTLINLKGFYRFSTKLLDNELELINILKYQLYDTDKKVCAWTIDVLGAIIKSNNEWAKNNLGDSINYLLKNFKIETIDSESSLISFAYLLNNLLKLYEGNEKQIVENLINQLKSINSQRINREFINIE